MSTIPMATWKDGLWSELFDDPTGDARPLSILHIDDALFARTLERQGLALSVAAAREAFLGAFPDRLRVQRWLAGSENPGEALLPLLVLCCLAASEAADSDENDYRGRMRDMMGWSNRIIDCAGLPRLWSRLAALSVKRAERTPTRTLVLPDPRFRTQIGHAIELTFPSRNDFRRLTRELAGETFDLDEPRAVLGWLAPLVAKRRFSSTFEETFNSFRDAWLDAERALGDHRFWAGWKLATQSLRDTVAVEPFEIVADEWGVRHLLDPESGSALDLERLIKSHSLPASLTALATRSHLIPLVETDWGKLRWLGAKPGRSADAVLIRQRAFGSRYDALRCVPVSGALGWGLTFEVAGALGERHGMQDHDRLLDVMPIGCTRVDGGVLARPALPFLIEATGHVASLSLAGSVTDQLTVTMVDPRTWRVTPSEPVEGEVRVIVEPRRGGMRLERGLRLRRSVLAPAFRASIPDRLIDPDPAPGADWPYVEEPGAAPHALPAAGAADVAQALLDLIEYLASRTAPIPFGAFIDVVRSARGGDDVNPWDVVQSLRDACVIKTLDVRGWRGRMVMSRPPRGALVRRAGCWTLVFEGCASETWIARVAAASARHGLSLERRPGVGRWSPPTLMLAWSDLAVLREVARSVETVVLGLASDLESVTTLLTGAPIAKGPAGAIGRPINLHGRHAAVAPLEPDQPNTRPLWVVRAGQETRLWKSRDDAILDAYSSVGERPFEPIHDRLSARDARLPVHVARWIRLTSGIAPGPVGDGYQYAWNDGIERELRRVARSFLMSMDEGTPMVTFPRSRRWRSRAVAAPAGPRAMSVWDAARGRGADVG